METYEVEIQGTTPLLHHKWGEHQEEAGKKGSRPVRKQQKTPREEAEQNAYRDPNGTLYILGEAIYRAMREAGSWHKLTDSRKSMKFAVPASVVPPAETIPLIDPDTKKPLTTFEVFGHRVVNKNTRGAMHCYRPRFDRWGAIFRLCIREGRLTDDEVHTLLQEAGQQIGIGAYRLQNGGPFGSFRVIKWEKI